MRPFLHCALVAALTVVIPSATAAQSGRSLIPDSDPAASAAAFRDVREARAALTDGRTAEAERLLTARLSAAPANGGLWHLLGETRERRGDREGAIAAYRRSFELGYRNRASLAYRVARLHALTGEDSAALGWLERALAHRLGARGALTADSAFAGLAGDPRFERLLPPDAVGLERDEALRQDLRYLLREARRLHVGPGRPAFSESFEHDLEELAERVGELSDPRVALEIGRILTSLEDGHSGLLGPMPGSPLALEGGSLPVAFYAFSDGLFIRAANEAHRDLVGDEVVAFGDVPADRAVDSLANHMHGDNPMTSIWLGVHHVLPSVEYLHAIGATDDPRSVTLTLRTPAGAERQVTLEPGAGPRAFERKLQPPPDPAPTPMYLERVADSYWLRPMPDRDALYFQFNQVRDAESGPGLAAFADTLRATLERTSARHLIIDVRHNNGGNNGLLRPLVQTLIWWEQDDPAHALWVITGRGTFSAAQNFISRVERWTDAVFVGEPSSSSPNFTGETTEVILPYSRLWVSVSNRRWQESGPDDVRPFIAPDLPVGLSSADYFEGRDPALEAILLAMDTTGG